MNLLLLNGSPRPDSLISQMLNVIKVEAEKNNFSINEFAVNSLSIKPCTGCMCCRNSGKCKLAVDDSQRFLEVLKNSDILVIGSPCYWANIPGQMKILFDRIVYGMIEDTDSFPKPLLSGKKAILISTCTTLYPFNILFGQSRGTINALKSILKYSGIKVISTIERGGTKKEPQLTNKDIIKLKKTFKKI